MRRSVLFPVLMWAAITCPAVAETFTVTTTLENNLPLGSNIEVSGNFYLAAGIPGSLAGTFDLTSLAPTVTIVSLGPGQTDSTTQNITLGPTATVFAVVTNLYSLDQTTFTTDPITLSVTTPNTTDSTATDLIDPLDPNPVQTFTFASLTETDPEVVGTIDVTISESPEPATVALTLIGIGLALAIRKRIAV